MQKEGKDISEDYEILCINKTLGFCPDCIPDVDASHPLNNTHCPGYHPTIWSCFTVLPKEPLGGEAPFNSSYSLTGPEPSELEHFAQRA